VSNPATNRRPTKRIPTSSLSGSVEEKITNGFIHHRRLREKQD